MSHESLWFLRNSTALHSALIRTFKIHLFHGWSVLQLSVFIFIYLSMTMAQQWSQKFLIFSFLLSFPNYTLEPRCCMVSSYGAGTKKESLACNSQGMHGTASSQLISYLYFIIFTRWSSLDFVPGDHDSICQPLLNSSGMPQGFPVSCTCLSLQWLPQFCPHGCDLQTPLDS